MFTPGLHISVSWRTSTRVKSRMLSARFRRCISARSLDAAPMPWLGPPSDGLTSGAPKVVQESFLVGCLLPAKVPPLLGSSLARQHASSVLCIALSQASKAMRCCALKRTLRAFVVSRTAHVPSSPEKIKLKFDETTAHINLNNRKVCFLDDGPCACC